MPGFQWLELFQSIASANPSVISSGVATAEVCRPVMRHAVEVWGCALAEVWSVAPRQRQMVLIGEHPSPAAQGVDRVDVLDFDTSLSGLAVQTKRAEYFPDLVHPYSNDVDREFKNAELRRSLGLKSMLSIPLRNTGNPHQVTCILNFFSCGDVGLSSEMIRPETADLFTNLAKMLSGAIESALRERCYRMAVSLDKSLTACDPKNEWGTMRFACSQFATCIQQAVSAESVAVYLKRHEQAGLRLEAFVGPGDFQPDSEVPPSVQDVFERNRELLVPNLDTRLEANFIHSSEHDCTGASIVLVPMHDAKGRSEGVVRCVRRPLAISGAWMSRFSYDDIAVIEAMTHTFAPNLQTMLASGRQMFTMQKLSHELRVPVITFRAILERMEQECTEAGFRFRFPHFREAGIYADLMTRLLREVDVIRQGPSQIRLRIQSTNILTDVVVPAVRFTIPLLRKKKFGSWQLEYSGFEDFPRLFVDPALITQILFNLVDNAIKHFQGDPSQFRCTIQGKRSAAHYEIEVTDNGPGICTDDVLRIFEYGLHGSNAHTTTGEGLGLWIARAVARRHGGDLVLKRLANPTTFVIKLPKSSDRR